jgi:putative tricarboxylic transport membrane protein
MLGALVLYGLQPGPLLFTESPDIVWPIIASMYIGNVALLILNLPLVPVFASVLRLPYWVLYPAVVVVSVVGVYSVNGSMFDVWTLFAFGLLGYAMRKLDVPPAPLVLAFVLGPLFERALRQTMVLSEGGLGIFLERPLSLVFLALAAVLLASPLFAVGRRLRREGIEDES